jgi:hypothetical protein
VQAELLKSVNATRRVLNDMRPPPHHLSRTSWQAAQRYLKDHTMFAHSITKTLSAGVLSHTLSVNCSSPTTAAAQVSDEDAIAGPVLLFIGAATTVATTMVGRPAGTTNPPPATGVSCLQRPAQHRHTPRQFSTDVYRCCLTNTTISQPFAG